MIFWGALGIICLIYFAVICLYAGLSSAFSWFWAMAGVVGLLLGFLWQKAPKGVHKGVWCIFAAGLAVLLLLEGKIFFCGLSKPRPEADYLIVLGCQIRGTKVSRSLKYRLDAAAEYVKENKDTVIIVSGGKGSGEDITEALAMKNYLVDKGIREECIWLEDKSVNTNENMKFSKELIEKQRKKERKTKDYRTVVVSNRFHLFRALKIGEKQGFGELEGLGGKTDPVLAVSYYIREAFAVVKDKLVGNFR